MYCCIVNAYMLMLRTTALHQIFASKRSSPPMAGITAFLFRLHGRSILASNLSRLHYLLVGVSATFICTSLGTQDSEFHCKLLIWNCDGLDMSVPAGYIINLRSRHLVGTSLKKKIVCILRELIICFTLITKIQSR